MAYHLRPTTTLAERVLLPGDPGRALALAQDLLQAPLMFNHHRGLWGYTGTAADGKPLTIQATGIGGPSAAIVVTELVALGARRLMRVGTCGALTADLRLGDLLVVDRALALDGASVALGAGDTVAPDDGLLAAARGAGPQTMVGTVASVDLFYGVLPTGAAGALAVEMEAASVMQVALNLGASAACVLVVTDELGAQETDRVRMDDDELTSAGLAVGRLGGAALMTAAV